MTERDKSDGEWHGWARTDGPNAWKMNRFERNQDPIQPTTQAVSEQAGTNEGPQWVDITHVVHDNIEAIRKGEGIDTPDKLRQKVWGGKSSGELQPNVPVTLTRINQGDATPFQQANYELLNGINTDAKGDLIVPENR